MASYEEVNCVTNWKESQLIALAQELLCLQHVAREPSSCAPTITISIYILY